MCVPSTTDVAAVWLLTPCAGAAFPEAPAIASTPPTSHSQTIMETAFLSFLRSLNRAYASCPFRVLMSKEYPSRIPICHLLTHYPDALRPRVLQGVYAIRA